MNNTYYFQHDYNPTNDPKIICLLGVYGGMGYGIFWRITEMLHQEKENKLPLKPYIYQAIAKQMLTSAEQVQKIIKESIDTFELFEADDKYFWSERVLENIEKRQIISEKRSEAGKLGAKVKYNLANAKQNLANTSKVKESKGKKRKLINDYFVFKDGTRAFKDKKDGVWKECDSFLKLEYVYLKELK